jgi:hypothetical protein
VVSPVGSTFVYLFAAVMGAATLAALAGEWLPPGLVAVGFAVFFILVLPRQPRFVAAFCAGAALMVAFTWVAWSVAAS